MDNGVKPVYRLTTALGRTIEATANHPFYTFDGWRLLEELEVWLTKLRYPRSVPVEGSENGRSMRSSPWGICWPKAIFAIPIPSISTLRILSR